MSRSTPGGPAQMRPRTLRPGRAHEALLQDPAFGPWVAHIGPPRLRRVTDQPFSYLVRSILYQQLAGAAAATIHGRFIEAVGGRVTPAAVKRTPDEALRGAGLSRGKAAAVRDLAEKAPSLQLHRLPQLSDEEIVDRLVTVRGVGPWTAHMFLIFALRRADVWPVGDLGVRAGYARVHGLDAVPAQKEMPALGEAFRPWRSAAAWYCWRVLETKLP